MTLVILLIAIFLVFIIGTGIADHMKMYSRPGRESRGAGVVMTLVWLVMGGMILLYFAGP